MKDGPRQEEAGPVQDGTKGPGFVFYPGRYPFSAAAWWRRWSSMKVAMK